MDSTETTFSLPAPRDAAEVPSATMSPRIQVLLDRAVEDQSGERREYTEALTDIRGQLGELAERVEALTQDDDERNRLSAEFDSKLAAVELLTVDLVEQSERRMTERFEASLVAVVEALAPRGSAASLTPTEATRVPDVDPLGPDVLA